MARVNNRWFEVCTSSLRLFKDSVVLDAEAHPDKECCVSVAAPLLWDHVPHDAKVDGVRARQLPCVDAGCCTIHETSQKSAVRDDRGIINLLCDHEDCTTNKFAIAPFEYQIRVKVGNAVASWIRCPKLDVIGYFGFTAAEVNIAEEAAGLKAIKQADIMPSKPAHFGKMVKRVVGFSPAQQHPGLCHPMMCASQAISQALHAIGQHTAALIVLDKACPGNSIEDVMSTLWHAGTQGKHQLYSRRVIQRDLIPMLAGVEDTGLCSVDDKVVIAVAARGHAVAIASSRLFDTDTYGGCCQPVAWASAKELHAAITSALHGPLRVVESAAMIVLCHSGASAVPSKRKAADQLVR